MNNHVQYSYGESNQVTTILHLAVEFSDAKILDYLVKYEAVAKLIATRYYPQDIQDLNFECTPIMIAAYRGDIELVKILIDKFKADITNPKDNISPVEIAFNNNKFNMVRFLLENGAEITPELKNQFEQICLADAHDLKDYLIEKKKAFDKILTGSIDEVKKVLLSNNVTINMTDFDGHTLLFRAVERKLYDKYGFLISIGADFSSSEKTLTTQFGGLQEQIKFDEAIQIYFKKSDDAIAYYLAFHTITRCGQDHTVDTVEIYKKLSAIDLVKPILEVLEFAEPKPVITLDMLNEHVGYLIPGYEEDETRGIFRRTNNHVYIGAKRDTERYGTLIHELTHFACELIYKNSTLPF